MPEPIRIALVTGADRGIGLAVVAALGALGHRVFLSALPGRAAGAAAPLQAAGHDVVPLDLDVTDAASVAAAVASIVERTGRIDILVNNAARGYDPDAVASAVDLDRVRDTLDVNLLGPWRLAQSVLPHMRAVGYGRIVNVSSDAGSFPVAEVAPVYASTPAYSVSKAAQNMLTVKLAAETMGDDILVNAVDPGWVRTDMGGPDAPRLPEEAAMEIVRLATLPAAGPTGCFFRDGRTVRW